MHRFSKYYFSGLFTMMVSLSIQAQNKGGSFHLTAGFQPIDGTVVNNWVLNAKPGYPAITDGYYSFGIGGYRVIKNVNIGVDLNMGVGRRSSTTTATLEPYTANLKLLLGYIIIQRKGVIVYPFVANGYGAFALRMYQADYKYPSFVPYEESRRENVILINQNFLTDIGFGTELYLGKNSEKTSQGFKLGVRLGYTYVPPSSQWQASKTPIANGPSFGPSGFFLRLLVGSGSITRK